MADRKAGRDRPHFLAPPLDRVRARQRQDVEAQLQVGVDLLQPRLAGPGAAAVVRAEQAVVRDRRAVERRP